MNEKIKIKAKEFYDSIEAESFAGTQFYRTKSTKRICGKLCDEIIQTLTHLTAIQSSKCGLEYTQHAIEEWEAIKKEIKSYKE